MLGREFLSPPPKGRLAVLDMLESFGLFGFFFIFIFLDRFPLMGARCGVQGGDEDGGAGVGARRVFRCG